MSEKNIYLITSGTLTQKKGTGHKMHTSFYSTTLVLNIFVPKNI